MIVQQPANVSQLLESHPYGFVTIDKDGNSTWMNAAARNIFGLEEGDFDREPIHLLGERVVGRTVVQLITEAFTGKSGESRVILPTTGEAALEGPYVFRCDPVGKEKEITGAMLTIRPLSVDELIFEQEELEELLLALHYKFPVGVLVANSKLDYSYCNLICEKMLGITSNTRNKTGWLNSLPDHLAENIRIWSEKNQADKDQSVVAEFLMNENKQFVRLSITEMVRGGMLTGYVCIFEDITEQTEKMSELEQVDEYQKTINYFAASLLGKNSINEILWDITKNCISNLGFVDCVIYLVDPERHVLVQKASYGEGKNFEYEVLNAIEIPVGQGIVGTVAETGKTELISNVTNDPRYIVDDAARLSEIAIPLIFEGKVIGVVDSEHPDEGFFTAHHKRTLETIASLCANKIARVKAEEKIRESEERLKLALKGGDLGMWDLDLNTGHTTHNARYASILGYSEEEFPVQHEGWKAIIHPDDRIPMIQALRSYLNSDAAFYEYEYRVKAKSGEWRWIFDRGRTAEVDNSGKPVRLIGTHLDVTERKRAEDNLRRNNFMLQAQQEATLDGILVMDESGAIVSANNRFLEDWGIEKVAPGSISATELFNQMGDKIQDGAEFTNLLDDEIKDHEVSIQQEVTLRNGKVFERYTAPILSPSDEYFGRIWYFKDITERKKHESDLQQLTNDLLRSNGELKQFAYITSHNLRAPVVNLVSLAALYDKMNPSLPANGLIFEKIEFCIDQLNSTLDDLIMIVSKKKVSREDHEVMSFDHILSGVKNSIEGQIAVSEANIISDFSAAMEISYPRGILRSILINFLTNALKYKSPDRFPEIHVSTQRQDGFIVLTVKDNGMGIDMSKHGAKLFGMYNRFNQNIEGKGLGLYIVKSQVEELGGKIEVSSELGKGTEFRVFLKKE